MDHPAVAVLHQVPRLAVDPAGRDTVAAEEVRVHRRVLAVPPRWRQVCELWRESHFCEKPNNTTASTSQFIHGDAIINGLFLNIECDTYK